jgi:hypothetical protein
MRAIYKEHYKIENELLGVEWRISDGFYLSACWLPELIAA